MDAFVTKKRQHDNSPLATPITIDHEGEDSTELKLALVSSILPDHDQSTLLEALLSCDGVVEAAVQMLLGDGDLPSTSAKKRRTTTTIGYQSSLSSFIATADDTTSTSTSTTSSTTKPLTKKGKTLYLYSPTDIAQHTPCSIRHNFLPPVLADALLRELLTESTTFGRETFKLFDNVVTSPHSFSFYVDDLDVSKQKTEYIYNGSRVTDVRRTPPQMSLVSKLVQTAVNEEIATRIRTHHGGRRLQFQSPKEWKPNTAFVNCYDGGKESVGWHADQLTYLGPRAVIGSLSLGVAREFRVRRVVARSASEGEGAGDGEGGAREDGKGTGGKKEKEEEEGRADVEGQISIHLPHNSLLVMHAEMQEEWKHSIAPAQRIDPHPVAGNKRLNVTYRCYRESFHPKYTPKCRCGVPTVLRCVMKKKENRGRYMWMCHAGYTPGNEGCTFFQWAEFDDDGEPPWAKDVECIEKAKVHEESKDMFVAAAK